MADISPAAQAVLDAVAPHYQAARRATHQQLQAIASELEAEQC